MTLTEYLAADRIVTDVRDDDVRGILKQLLDPVVRSGWLASADVVLAALLAREKVLSTGIGHGIAIPHAISSSIPEPQVLIGICPSGGGLPIDGRRARTRVLRSAVSAGPGQSPYATAGANRPTRKGPGVR